MEGCLETLFRPSEVNASWGVYFCRQYALPRLLGTAARGRLTISLDLATGHSKIYGIFFDDPYWEEDANLKLSYY